MQSGLFRFLSPPSFDRAQYLVESAWLEHAPFAYHIVSVLQPKVLVELGTYHGFSFFAFCQAIDKYSVDTFAYAIDTWTGDEHAGLYGDQVFAQVRNIHTRYSAYSTLIRSTFSQAVSEFADGSIDLLHIDGRHLYDDVKRDFEEWAPKLSKNAIVLFHDTNVHDHNFGVWRYFDELRERHSTFNFTHGNGLGVLAVGDVPEALRAFFEADSDTTAVIRLVYSRLGQCVTDAYNARRLGDIEARYDAQGAEIAALQGAAAGRASEVEELRQQISDLKKVSDQNTNVIVELSEDRTRSAELEQRIADLKKLSDQNTNVIVELSEKLLYDPSRSLADRLDRRVVALEELARKLDVGLSQARDKLDVGLSQARDKLDMLDVGLSQAKDKLDVGLSQAREATFRAADSLSVIADRLDQHSVHTNGHLAEIDRRMAKAERRILRLRWHAAILMPLTGPFVLVFRYIWKKISPLIKRSK
jgi:predicted O-methyltransferase YrrM